MSRHLASWSKWMPAKVLFFFTDSAFFLSIHMHGEPGAHVSWYYEQIDTATRAMGCHAPLHMWGMSQPAHPNTVLGHDPLVQPDGVQRHHSHCSCYQFIDRETSRPDTILEALVQYD
ncbi:hypothetical protein H2248_007606 [Termitomyces sp. 'cryptogamus']|nr:hypothetical protein H2248_007606 [Termitomyces sp. 'cryptogamus']